MSVSRMISALRKRSVADVLGYGVILTRNALGLPNHLRTPDRDLLERTILPRYATRGDVQTVLFVGCEWFTRHYEQLIPGRSYWTIDPDPWKRQFGARDHVTAGLEDLTLHFPGGHFDLIVCNGVYGWGLDDAAACEKALAACFECLRESGELVFGWNDVPEHAPVSLATLPSYRRFTPLAFDALGGATQVMADPQTRHIFEFFVKQPPRAG